jgi:ribosomal protein S6--L-glutamate ligase
VPMAAAGDLVVGTFVPPAIPGAPGAQSPGKVSPADHARFIELLDSLEGVRCIHNLDIAASHIRDGRVYVGDLCLNDLDLFFWLARIDRGLGSYALEALKTFGMDTKVVPDPAAFDVGLDKYRAHLALGRAGVSVAESVLFDHRNLAAVEPVLDGWGRAVLKPRRGRFGKGVLLVEDFGALRDLAGYLESTVGAAPDKAYLLERFYDNDPETWVGTTQINDSIMYGYRKRPDQWTEMGSGAAKVYDALEVGSQVDLCDVSPAHGAEALRAQEALGLEFVGFDMVLHEGRPIIVDENTLPALYTELFDAVGKDLATELARLVEASLPLGKLSASA